MMKTLKLSKKNLSLLQEKANAGDQEAIETLAQYEAQQAEKERKKQERKEKRLTTVRRDNLSAPPMDYVNFEDQQLGSPVEKLSKDLKGQVTQLTIEDIRYLVDSYYQIQNNRIRSSNQVRASEELGEANGVLVWINENNTLLENNIKKALDIYTDYTPVGRWLKSIVGIGPVLAAGLLAHLDITKAETAGAFWRFAGLDPSVTWDKGQKRPWNADLKTHMWKIADSFVKQSSRPSDYYGKIYLGRKRYEQEKNEKGEYRLRAERALQQRKFVNETDTKATYESGKITNGHIESSARRYVEKIFLSHLHHVMYLHHHKIAPPKPFAISILNHAHMIEVPNLEAHYDDLIKN